MQLHDFSPYLWMIYQKSSIIYYNEEALATLKEDIITFAENEALTAHANAN